MSASIAITGSRPEKLFEDLLGFANDLGNRSGVQFTLVEAFADLDGTFNPHHDGDVSIFGDLVLWRPSLTVEDRERHVLDVVLDTISKRSTWWLYLKVTKILKMPFRPLAFAVRSNWLLWSAIGYRNDLSAHPRPDTV